MISRGIKKRVIIEAEREKMARKKSKSKSKSRQKAKRILAPDFLQAFIDLQNTNCSTNKKKRNTTRDVTSALTIATPGLQKNFSNSKIRSRSSFSQYRKKFTSSNNKQPLKIELSDVITQQDNVQYTEKTARSNAEQQQQHIKKQINSIICIQKNQAKRKINLDVCATKIQRAWRNYQTYKMIYQAYLKEKKNSNLNYARYVLPQSNHAKSKKFDLEKTLKIKKDDLVKKQGRKQQQLIQTKKVVKQRFRIESTNSQKYHRKSSPIQEFDESSEEMFAVSPQVKQDSMIQKIKEMQAERFNEVINLIEKQSKNKSKEDLLNQLIIKFEQNKSRLQTEMNKHLQCIQHSDTNTKKQPNNYSNYILKQKQNYQNIDIKEYDSESSVGFDYDPMVEDFQEFKIFDQRIKIIKEQKIKKLQKVDSDFQQHKILNQQAIQKKQFIYNKFQKEIKEVEKHKKQFVFSLTQLKKSALKCQKSALLESSSLSKLRKSFSAGNTVLKSVLQQIKITQIQEDFQQKSYIDTNIIKIRPYEIESEGVPLTNTPIINLSSPTSSKSSSKDNIEQKLVDKINTEAMKQSSQHIQQLIEKQLIQQFVRSIFVEVRLYNYFRPYIEDVYQFTKLQDTEICNFMKSMKQYFPEQTVMLKRVNQKINPTSLQILKIIRDLDYEIDEYELIIPQDCFKKYRSSVQKVQEQINSKIQIDKNEISLKINDKQLVQKIYLIELQKKEKMKKYRNFQKDLKIMYMKSVFNCVNEFLIQCKSSNAFMNARSSIGPGELTLALKQYNEIYDAHDCRLLFNQVDIKLQKIINQKCAIPSFQNYQGISKFQNQVMKQIQIQSNENEFKWINYMDQVLQIWQDLCISIIGSIIEESCFDILSIFK